VRHEKINGEFLDKVMEVAERRKETLEWLKAVFDELTSQIESRKWDAGRLAAAIEKAKRVAGYHQDYAPALHFLYSNWASASTVPVTTTVPATRASPSSSSFAASSSSAAYSPASSSSSSSGARWEQMIKEREKREGKKKALKKSEKHQEILEVSLSGKGSRLENALEKLRLESCISWFKYLRDTGQVGFVGSLGTEASAFGKCRTAAAEVVDPLLKSRNIYNDAEAITSDLAGASSSQTEESLIQVVLDHYGLTDPTKPTYWYAKGLILYMNPTITIRCDGSAALAFYLLCQEAKDKGFTASIGLVRQGEPRWSGHWFLVAGVQSQLKEENINSYKDVVNKSELKRSWCFVIDLWGAFFQQAKTTVGYPAFCVAGDWGEIKILWTV
jgi:hypothetical protein